MCLGGSPARALLGVSALALRLFVSPSPPSAQCAPAAQPSVGAVPIDRRSRSSRSLFDTALCCVRAVVAVGLAAVLVGIPRPTYVFLVLIPVYGPGPAHCGGDQHARLVVCPSRRRSRVRGTQLYVDCETRRLSGLSPRGRGGDDLGPLGASVQTGLSPCSGNTVLVG